MSAQNAIKLYRPLKMGIRITNGVVRKPGTLGFFAKSNDNRFWIVSCYHVLVRPSNWNGDNFEEGEPIYQPTSHNGSIVARTSLDRIDEHIDCAAVEIDNRVSFIPEILALGKISQPKEPLQGMRVFKAGAVTGVTEGIISNVADGIIQIGPPDSYPQDYQLSKAGDSGGLWLEQSSKSPIAMHQIGNTSAGEFAKGVSIIRILNTLNLDIVN